MPVSPLPLLLPLVFLALLIWGAFGGWKRFRNTVLCVFAILLVVLAPFHIPGAILRFQAERSDAHAKYRYAKWLENTPGAVSSVILWPVQPNVLDGYRWLERAAEQDFAPALYVQGVRLKYGTHVPEPEGWTRPGGNVFPQPERGQELIDKALSLGFEPKVKEEWYYWQVYRGTHHRDPHG